MKKSLFVTICGLPNAGKSTLLNALIGQKVSIVSPKVQTTRDNIKGILTEKDSQVVFIDTPGVFKPKKELEKKIVKNAHRGIREGGLICLVIDATVGINKDVEFLIREIKEKEKKCILIINKIDLIEDGDLLNLLQKSFDPSFMEEIFPISAKNNKGIEKLKNFLLSRTEEDVWYYNEDDITDRSLNFIAAEITREKVFLLLKEEIPYGVSVTTDKTTFDDDLVKIDQTILVSRQGHKNIVIGKKGSQVSQIIKLAVPEIEDLFGRRVMLSVFVKVNERWISEWGREP